MAYKREISAILFSLASLFIFFAAHFPDKTGFIGHALYAILIESFGKRGALCFPLFLLLPAFSMMITPVKIYRTSIASLISYLLTVILIQMHYNPITHYSWPADTAKAPTMVVLGSPRVVAYIWRLRDKRRLIGKHKGGKEKHKCISCFGCSIKFYV